ncbi:olfactory receptor 9G19-like [Leptodactylus fuscus]
MLSHLGGFERQKVLYQVTANVILEISNFDKLVGNLILIALVCGVPQLHTPMYFFLCNLSSVDVIYVSTVLPKMLSTMLTKDKTISSYGCITQLSFFLFCGNAENNILASMAYDRYVAKLKMNNCDIRSVTEFYLTPFSTSKINEILIFTGFLFMYLLAVVGNLILIALVCGVPQLHTPMYFFLCNLSSVDAIYVSAILPKMLSTILTEDKTISSYGCITQLSFFIFCDDIIVSLTFLLIVTSYVKIISTILKIRSSKDQLKVFSSCSSHIITVLLFYGPAIFVYMKPKTVDSKEEDKILSMFYVAVVPMLNPFVYSLRNKEILGAARKVIKVTWNRIVGK